MRYFVTGATGFVGGRVARQLREAGHDVVAVVRTPTKASDLLNLGVAVVQGDVTDKASMRAPMTGVDGVFHIAGWYKVGAGRTAGAEGQAINVDGTRNVLELMEELGSPRQAALRVRSHEVQSAAAACGAARDVGARDEAAGR